MEDPDFVDHVDWVVRGLQTLTRDTAAAWTHWTSMDTIKRWMVTSGSEAT